MKFLQFFRTVHTARGQRTRERERLHRAMPGETGALAALRVGVLVR
ncbi:hypothetical protein [Chelativorans sp.]|nr:hypothetical protein [Chelativorans sp.]